MGTAAMPENKSIVSVIIIVSLKLLEGNFIPKLAYHPLKKKLLNFNEMKRWLHNYEIGQYGTYYTLTFLVFCSKCTDGFVRGDVQLHDNDPIIPSLCPLPHLSGCSLGAIQRATRHVDFCTYRDNDTK